jgi:hypothetical protein
VLSATGVASAVFSSAPVDCALSTFSVFSVWISERDSTSSPS